ncbi:MAG: Preprotein translocase subunit SecG [Candidatus Thorarchaeota archaeon]|nr:MAG: Preprotein translocase subunit SecG [Candidatus Thorarchaeota archaeon]
MVKKKSGKKKKRSSKSDGGGMTGGAGLIRFFEDETPGIKVGPTVVIVFAAMLVVAIVIAHINALIQVAS